MATAAIVTGGSLANGGQTAAIVTGGVLSTVGQTAAIVTGGTLSSGGSSTTQAVVTGGFLASGQLEPFMIVKLPAGGWTQTAGPAVDPTALLLPAALSPGVTLTYTQPAASFTFKVLPHTMWRCNENGQLQPIRLRVPPFTPDPIPSGATPVYPASALYPASTRYPHG